MARFVSTTAAGQRRSRHEVWTGFPFQPPARATPTMHNISGYRSLSTLNVVVFRPLRHKGGWIGGAAAGWPGQSRPDTRLGSRPPGSRLGRTRALVKTSEGSAWGAAIAPPTRHTTPLAPAVR